MSTIIVDNKDIGYVRELADVTSFKSRLKFKYLFKKRDLKYRLANIKEQFILKFIMPQFLDYVRDVIIAKGLDPDKNPFAKSIKQTPVFDDLFRKDFFNHYVPKWVSDSFRDPTKHILYYNRNKTFPVEKPQSIEVTADEVTVGIDDDQISDGGFLAIKNLIEKLPIDPKGNIVPPSLNTEEGRTQVHKKAIEVVKKRFKSTKR